nr:Chain B, Unknown peptide, probably from expression host [Escherichia coli BL21(DE3)]
PAWLFEA